MRLVGILSDLLAAGLAALAVYTAGFGVFDNAWFSGLIVALAVAIALLRGAGDRPVLLALHGALALLFAWLSWVWLGIMLEQEAFFIEISRAQLLQAWLAIAVIAYVTWREFGLPMLLVGLAAAAWLLLGAGEDWARAAENLWYSTDGVYGRPVEVVGRIVLVFIVFGAVLQTSGAGAVLLKMAFAATARFTGGAAHASIVASALFGTLSGAAVANVVSTGVFTIPIIKRAGFRPRFAGAVEAAASTGGQIMPPVMGVVAFLMADVTNIPYLQIVVAATIPALMYYASLFVVVAVEARRLGIAGTPAEAVEPVTPADWVKSLAFFLPLVAIVVVLVDGRTPQFAGAAALVLATVLSLILFPAFRHPRMWWQALVEAGRTSAKLMVIVAAIGFVIGVINMTGIGLMFAQAILRLSDDSLFLSLLLVMLGCLVMGMGVPSAPAYLIVAIVMGPALERLGVPTIGAHLFMLYFAVLSVVTPPVALAAFAAAPIAGAGPMETGMTAMRLALPGFVIPFLFVYWPSILLIDGVDLFRLAWSILVFAAATWMIVTGLGRFQARILPGWEAALRIAAAILALYPSYWPSAIGIAGAIALTVLHTRAAQLTPKPEAPEKPKGTGPAAPQQAGEESS